MNIGGKIIGGEHPTFIIAELSANHKHEFDIAAKTIVAAKEAGADAIKLQTYTADTMTIDADNEHFRIQVGLWKGRTLYDLYKEAHTPWEWHADLMKIAKENDIICFSTPFDSTAVDFLEDLDVPAYKVASFEIQDIPLIKYIASQGKPMILSTGIAKVEDIDLAVEACRSEGNDDFAILKCTSAYPTPMDACNLNAINTLKERYGVTVGLSDHTLGHTIPLVAVTLGARIVEKHFIVDKSVGGPDVEFSMEPNEFKAMVDQIRSAESAMGDGEFQLSDEVKSNKIFARSLFVVKDIDKGQEITKENVRSIRPGNGMHPKHYDDVMGRSALEQIEAGTPLEWGLISE